MSLKWFHASIASTGAAVLAIGCATPATQEPEGSEPSAAGEAATQEVAGAASSLEVELAEIDRALTANPNDSNALARAAALNARADQQMGLLHTIDVGQGRTVKFYLTPEGGQIVGQTGPIDVDPVLPNGFAYTNFAELHQYLKPAEAVPAALVDADNYTSDRMLDQQPEQAVMPAAAAPATVEDAEELIDKHATSSCAHFEDEHRCRSGDGFICACNRTGGGTWTLSPANRSYQMIAAYRGTISVDILRNSGYYGPYVVPQGTLQWWTMTASQCEVCSLPNTNWGACNYYLCDETHGHRIYNATDDGYHRHICIDNTGVGNCN